MVVSIIYIVLLYVVIIFILSRFFIPHLKFWPERLPDNIPGEMELIINQLKAKANSPMNFLKLSYEYIGDKYRSERFNTILKFHYLFKDLNEVWRLPGYMPCTQSNCLMKIFLVRSGFFKESDIKTRHVFVNFVPHQYLKVRIGSEWFDIDVGEKQRGMPIGKHLKYFG